jgi:phage-related tail fiber protein
MTTATASKDGFTYAAIREIETELLASGDEHRANAVYEAMHGANTAAAAIRSTVADIRRGLDEVMRTLDGGFNVYEAREVQRAAELDMAIVKRSMYIQQLVALLGPAKVQELLAK